MKTKLALGAAVVLLAATPAMADLFVAPVNFSWPNNQSNGAAPLHSFNFNLPGVVSVKSITLDISHSWGNDLRLIVTGPAGETFNLMDGEVSVGGSGNFDLGFLPADITLGNAGPYTFVDIGGGSPSWANGHALPGIYDANAWHPGPMAAGAWVLDIWDTVGGDGGSIGVMTIDYNPIPAPGVVALLGVAGLASRRRRR